MNPRPLVTLGPDHESLWVRRCVHAIGEAWAAMIVGDDMPSPVTGEVKGLGLFAQIAGGIVEAGKIPADSMTGMPP